MLLEIRSNEHGGDGSEVRMCHWIVLEAGEEGHGEGHVGLGSEGVDEDGKRKGFGRWVCEEDCGGEVDCCGEVV